MNRFLSALLLIITLSACTPVATPPAIPTIEFTPAAPSAMAQPTSTPMATEWAGAITHTDGRIESIVLRFTESGGTLTIEPLTQTYNVEDFKRTDAELAFDVTTDNELRFSGEFDEHQIIGQVESGEQTDTFSLIPLFSQSADSRNDFLGTYQFEAGGSLLINLAPEYSSSGFYFFGQGLMLTDFRSGAIRALYPIAEDTFLVGSARAVGYPFTEQITFTRDSSGSVTGLTWQARDVNTGSLGAAEQATRLLLSSEVVHFTSEDGTSLTGLLTLPADSGPFPAIMMLHGSEPGTRDNFGNQQMSAFMASQGIAILTYDKRGVGESGGHYGESASETNLNLTARDAIAGIEYLKTRPEINTDQIGLTGFSQAGWVIPIAASQSEDISYFIILSGPVTSVGHENLYSSFTNNGSSPTNQSEDELMARLDSSPHSGFDSTPVIATLGQRGLWVFGNRDKSIPIPECVSNLETIIAGGKSSFTYVVLENADHNLQQTTQGLFNEIPYSPGYHIDYYKTIAQWLEEYVK